MKQHVHARKVVGGNVVFLAVNFANTMLAKLLTYIEEQRDGSASKIQYFVQVFFLTRSRLLAVEGDNFGKNTGNLLGCIKLPGFFAGTRCKLPDQIFIGITENVATGRKL